MPPGRTKTLPGEGKERLGRGHVLTTVQLVVKPGSEGDFLGNAK